MDTVAAGVTQLRIQHFVSVYFVDTGTPGDWVLIGTGLPGSEKAIRAAAAELYGAGIAPQAIVLTHGHLLPRLGLGACHRLARAGAGAPAGAAPHYGPGPVPAARPYRGRLFGVCQPLFPCPTAGLA